MNQLTIHTDGGSRGNPGPAACAAVFLSPDSEVIHSVSRFLGRATNNEAEYQAVVLALETVLQDLGSYSDYDTLDFVLDSELVVKQLTGIYKIKKPELYQLVLAIRQLIIQISKKTTFRHVRRHLNKLPDQLLNEELDRN